MEDKIKLEDNYNYHSQVPYLGLYLTKVHFDFDIVVISCASGYFGIGYSARAGRNSSSSGFIDRIKAMAKVSLLMRIANS